MKYIIIPIVLLLFVGCTQSLYMQGRSQFEEGRYESAIEKYYEELKVNPDNYRAWRELGVTYYKKGEWIKAEDALKQANNIRPDARTNLFMGLLFEQKKQFDKAITAYAAAINLEGSGETKNMIRSHLDNLIQSKFKSETATVIENEAQINADTIPENTIAVISFDGSALSPELEPISYGLAEFMAVDLSKVSSLSVVDRLKIDMLLDELKLSRSKYADRTTAPRLGRLLGSRKIITGTLLSTGANTLRLDGAVVNTTDSTTELTEPTEGDLNKFFELQKDFTFKIIDSLGVKLTREERDAIAEVPTESFIAFMSYARGLKYQSLGMNQAAFDAYKQAASEDKNFSQPNLKMEKLQTVMEGQAAGEAGAAATTEEFESEITEQTDKEEFSTGLDEMQYMNLDNSGFIYDRHSMGRIIEPPYRRDVSVPTATVIIRGDLDAE